MNLRQEVRKENLKRWKAQGPAVIQKPLKLIHARYPDFKDKNGAFAGHHPLFAKAKYAAAHGDGGYVNEIARWGPL